MASVKLYLDTRRGEKEYPLKLRIMHNHKNVSINLGIKAKVEQWDADSEEFTRKMPNWKNLNDEIHGVLLDMRNVIRELTNNGRIKLMSASDLKKFYKRKSTEVHSDSTFANYYKEYISKVQNAKTRQVYEDTLKKVTDFAGTVLMFEDITYPWLNRFDEFMQSKSLQVNSRSIHLRNIRAVLYSALDNEVTSVPNPFRKFKIKSRKESATFPLTLQQFTSLKNYNSPREAVMISRDVFLISFYLVGINMSDLYNLKKGERCRYSRQKTSKVYDIGLQPEIKEFISRYEDKKYMFSFHERYNRPEYFIRQVNRHLKVIGKEIGIPDLHTYHARHTWATFARSIRIPRDIIAECLGHSIKTTTDIYARFDPAEIDKANREVLDHIAAYEENSNKKHNKEI